jgi:hypothetical protein
LQSHGSQLDHCTSGAANIVILAMSEEVAVGYLQLARILIEAVAEHIGFSLQTP